MKYTLFEVGSSLFKLFRFLFWYGLGVAVVFYVLPKLAIDLQFQYEALSSIARYAVLSALIVLIVCLLMHSFRAHHQSVAQTRLESRRLP